MLGNGALFNKIKRQIEKYDLKNEINLVGAVDSDKVREYMEKTNIFLCTSDKTERWGVVLNEAMNSGCVTIANKDIGGVPFLINDNENGFAYSNFSDLYNKTIKVIDNKELREKMSINAYYTIAKMWTANNATNNLELLIDSINNKKENPIKEGPASNAYPVKY